ncbi:DUF5994 family protein [Streptomyces luteogriseus]|uniref:DUF5994 family protein n=1 Tax=Streptomyces luteogriseus TaxID=68233 RepID=UPI0037A551EC
MIRLFSSCSPHCRAPGGRIGGVTVSGAARSAAPGRMFVADQVVRLRKTVAVHAPDTVVLLTPGHGRWDLLVVPPGTTEERAVMIGSTAPDTAEAAWTRGGPRTGR